MEAITWGLTYFWQPFSKNSQYLVNGESDKKNVTNKKDAKFNFLSGVCYQIECIFNHYSFITSFLKTEKSLLSQKWRIL